MNAKFINENLFKGKTQEELDNILLNMTFDNYKNMLCYMLYDDENYSTELRNIINTLLLDNDKIYKSFNNLIPPSVLFNKFLTSYYKEKWKPEGYSYNDQIELKIIGDESVEFRDIGTIIPIYAELEYTIVEEEEETQIYFTSKGNQYYLKDFIRY